MTVPFKKYKGYMLVPHKLDSTKVLRNLGYDVPSPILTRYDWAGQTPFDSQKITAAILTLSRRAYVLNEMGTGKTLAALFAYDFLRQHGAANKLLVVAPLSTLNVVWAQEVFQRMPHLETSVVHGTKAQRWRALDADADIYLINHDGLKVLCEQRRYGRSTKWRLGPELSERDDIDTVLIDELAIYRNRQTDRWKTAHAAIQGRKWAWGMTGGPTPKAPTDAWAQVQLLTPERTTWSFKAFREEVMYQVSQFKWLPRDNSLEQVHNIMQPSVRYTRAECIDLPPTTYSDREVQLTSEQSKAYQQMQDNFYMQHPQGKVTAANAGVQMGKLLQCVTGFLYNGEETIELKHEPRIDVLKEIIEEAEGKIIVFVPFKRAINLVEAGLKGFTTTSTVTGATPKKERDRIFNHFQHTSTPHVLIAHPRVAAHGLTLTRANTIAWYTIYPDLEIYEQACARVARPGQKLSTHIIHLVSSKIEQRVARTLQNRGNLQQALLSLFEEDNR